MQRKLLLRQKKLHKAYRDELHRLVDVFEIPYNVDPMEVTSISEFMRSAEEALYRHCGTQFHDITATDFWPASILVHFTYRH
jgi:hypothetical protein